MCRTSTDVQSHAMLVGHKHWRSVAEVLLSMCPTSTDAQFHVMLVRTQALAFSSGGIAVDVSRSTDV